MTEDERQRLHYSKDGATYKRTTVHLNESNLAYVKQNLRLSTSDIINTLLGMLRKEMEKNEEEFTKHNELREQTFTRVVDRLSGRDGAGSTE